MVVELLTCSMKSRKIRGKEKANDRIISWLLLFSFQGLVLHNSHYSFALIFKLRNND